MIFCAGLGTRMGKLTQDTPKPLLKVGDKTLLEHAVAQLPSDIKKVANTHYLADQFSAPFHTLNIHGLYEPEILETGGGLKNALSALKSDAIYTMNTDAIWLGPCAYESLLKAWQPEKMDALLLTVPIEKTYAHLGNGDFDIDADMRLRRGHRTVYTGLQIIKTNVLDGVDKTHFSLNVIWNRLFEQGRIYGTQYTGHWCDVGHPEGLVIAQKQLEARHV